MMSARQWVLLSAAMLAAVEPVCGQKTSNWRVYKLADGLPESACFSVTVSSQDRIVVRHLNLPQASELDGYTIVSKPALDIGKNRIYQSPGGQLWTAVPDGLREFKDGTWIFHPVAEIASQPHLSRVIDPVPLYAVKQGLVIFLLPDRLSEFNSENPDHPQTRLLRRADQTSLGPFSGMAPAGDGGLWIVGQFGAAKIPGPLRNLQPQTGWTEYLVPSALHVENLDAPHPLPRAENATDQRSGFCALADSSTNQHKVLVFFDGQTWGSEPVPVAKPRQAWIGTDNIRWAIAINSLYSWDEGAPGEPSENEEVSARQYFDLAVDFTGKFWLATSDGLFRYAPLPWRTPATLRKLNSPVRCLTGDREGRLWFISGNRVQRLQGGKVDHYPVPSLPNRILEPHNLYCLKNSVVVLEADDQEAPGGAHLFALRPGQTEFVPILSSGAEEQFKAVGLLADSSLCLWNSKSSSSNPEAFLARYDGYQIEKSDVPEPPRSLGANLRNSITTQSGDLWLNGDLGTACYRNNKWTIFTSTDRSTPEAAIGFIELPDGRIWCADQSQIWEFDGRNWAVVRRGFDQINSLLSTREGNIWVACNNGLYRYYQNVWIENNVEEGLSSATVRELYRDSRGVWAATTRGLSLFYPQTDRDPPAVTIQQLPELGKASNEGKTFSLAFIGQDKWRHTPRDRLLFSYRLDDHEWSSYQEIPYFSPTDLPAGKHYFQVRAMDRSGNQSKPAQREFAIVLPWYKETRLLLIACAGLGAALFFAGVAFNRHRQLLRSYAEVERKVGERTKQLEVANYELFQSQKMKALGTLAAGIAHDFNNILSIIKGSAQIIEDNLNNPTKIRTRADRIKTVVDQGAGIVKAMLGFSRDSGQEMTLCDPNAVIEDTLKLLGDRFLREVHVRFQPTVDLPPVLSSKEFIQQILLNFIFNAFESMTRTKEVTLTSRIIHQLPVELALLPVPAPAYLAIAVQDFGCGIPPQILPRIFEPFFTTKALSARRGTGLGLSMAYELAKKLGAGIYVESIVDHGSTFTLILPIQNQKQRNPPQKASLAISDPV